MSVEWDMAITTARETVETAPVIAPPPGNPRFPLFDGLRAIAALTVFVYHVMLASEEHHGAYTSLGSGFGYQLLSHLDWGVAIFFLISGFLLYRPFAAARFGMVRATPVRVFLRRRVLRVIPAYWLALTVLAIYPGLGLTLGNSWRFYGLAHIYFPSTSYAGLAVSWTLCVEASFYLLLPLYSLAVGRLTVRHELVVLGSLFLIAMLLQVYVTDGGHTTALYFLTRTLALCLDWFALGMVLALVSAAGVRRSPLNGSGWWWVASAGIWLGCVLVEGVKPYLPFRHLAYGLAAFCLLVPAVFDGRGVVARVLSLRWLAWLGLISYGVYLWQLRLLLLLHDWGLDGVVLGGAGLALTVVIAAVSYYVLERPILRLKYRASPR